MRGELSNIPSGRKTHPLDSAFALDLKDQLGVAIS